MFSIATLLATEMAVVASLTAFVWLSREGITVVAHEDCHHTLLPLRRIHDGGPGR